MRSWRSVGLLAAGVSVVLAATACLPMHAAQESRTVNQNAPTSGSVGNKAAGAVPSPAADGQLRATFGTATSIGDGEYANQSVQPNLHTSDPGDFIYAPTMKPPGGSCIEVVTAYTHDGGAVWAWDWCAATPGPAAELKIDRSFLDTYTINMDGHIAYTVEVIRTDTATNTWTAMLYNYRTQSWQTLFTSSGTDKSGRGSLGWDIFEVYGFKPPVGNASYCGDAAGDSFDSSGIQILVGGSWRPVDASNSHVDKGSDHPQSGFGCWSLNFQLSSPNNHWIVQD
jgi:hypothetical protein